MNPQYGEIRIGLTPRIKLALWSGNLPRHSHWTMLGAVRCLDPQCGVYVNQMKERIRQMSENTPEVPAAEADSDPMADPAQPEVPPIDFNAVSAATEEHATAVKAAHDTLAMRIGNAYAICAADLDRAYQVWEDVSNAVRQGVSFARDIGGAPNGADQDPANAR
jgi:hypothetical protein